MYVPDAFQLHDRAALLAHASAYPFATVITRGETSIGVSHLPLLVDVAGNLLRGHLARKNEQHSHLVAGAEVLAIFHGPHGYVSPSVYADQAGVPTWNYVVVHVRGTARLVDEAGLRVILDDTVTRFDRAGWRPEANEQLVSSMLAAIAGFEIEIHQVEGKWKLSQNRSLADQAHVVTWLESGDDQSRALASLMRGRL
jgi:transcriptional regulator